MISPISETYMLANTARAKLTKEAARSDHDLRKLVAHANLLDNLMDKIHNNDYEEPSPIKQLTFAPVRYEPTTVTIIQDDSDSDSSDDEDDEDEDEDDVYFQETTHSSVTVAYDSDDSEDEFDDDLTDEEYEEGELEALSIKLARVHSANFKTMPTIDELSEGELQEMEDYSSESEEEEEIDIVDLRKTPSLGYSSSTDDEEEVDEEEHYLPEEVDFTEQGLWNKNKITNNNVLISEASDSFLNQNTTQAILC